jgi:hypothetical protein
MANREKIYIPAFISDQNFNPAKVLPHLYFYNSLKECERYFIQSGSTYVSQSSFPYFDNYSGLETTTSSLSLLFFNEPAVYGTTPTASLYNQYWEDYVELLYNPRTRLLNASAIIPLADYFKMELNDIVEFRGNRYHLRAINDYNLKNGECQIQLLGPIINTPATFEGAPTSSCAFTFSSIDDSAMELEIFTTASNYSVTLPVLTGPSTTNRAATLFTASWGDGTTSYISGSYLDVNATHTYTSPGTYKIQLTGSVGTLNSTSITDPSYNSSLRLVLTKVNKWGSVGVQNLGFSGCGALQSIPDGDLGLYRLDTVLSFIGGISSGVAPFSASKMETLPSNLFKFSPNLRVTTNFAAYNKNFKTVPQNLFLHNNYLSLLGAMFFSTNIETLPNVMFAPGVNNLVNFDGDFQATPLLTSIPSTLFDNLISGSTNGGCNFNHAFYQPNPNVLSGNAPTLWFATSSYTNLPFNWVFGTDGPFEGCTGLTNYASIPTAWK